MAGECGAKPLRGETMLPLRGKIYPEKRAEGAAKSPKYLETQKNTAKKKKDRPREQQRTCQGSAVYPFRCSGGSCQGKLMRQDCSLLWIIFKRTCENVGSGKHGKTIG